MGRISSLLGKEEGSWQFLAQLIPGMFLGAGMMLGLRSALAGTVISPLVAVLIAAGCMPMVMEWLRRPLGSSTALLHLQSHHKGRLHALLAHARPRTTGIKLRNIRGRLRLPLAVLVLGSSLLAAIYAWLVSTYLPSGSGLQLVAQLVPFAGMLYVLREWKCSITINAVLLGVFGVSFATTSIVSGLLVVLLLLGVVIERSLRTNNLSHLPLAVGGSYLAYVYWLWGATGQDQLLLLAQVLLATYMVVLVPFVLRRRVLPERGQARLILGINALGFTLFTCLALASTSLEGVATQPSWVLLVTLSVSAAAAAIAWLVHGQFSYAKYHALAGLLSVLVTVSLLIPTSSLITDLWLFIALACAVGAQYLRSRSLRVVSVVSAAVAAAFWMGSQVVREDPAYNAWTGLLVVGVVLFCAAPPKHHPLLRLPGYQREERLIVQLVLLSAALLGFGTLTSVLGLRL